MSHAPTIRLITTLVKGDRLVNCGVPTILNYAVLPSTSRNGEKTVAAYKTMAEHPESAVVKVNGPGPRRNGWSRAVDCGAWCRA